jgi:CRP/FNR family transcriptional regulator, cyclic AMP receptor protein
VVESSRLASLPIFSDLTEEERTGIASYVDAVEVPAGEKIASEGEFAYEFFVVESGTAEVQTRGNRLAELGPGDFFGELGLLVTGRRTADVVASSPMTLIAMFDRNFRQLERNQPTFSERIRSVLKERIARRSSS